MYVHELIFSGHDLVSNILFDIYRQVCDNGVEEFINIMNHVKTEFLTHYIKCWLNAVGLKRSKIKSLLNWDPKGQQN